MVGRDTQVTAVFMEPENLSHDADIVCRANLLFQTDTEYHSSFGAAHMEV